MNKTLKNTLQLFAITAVAGLLLGLVYEGTEDARAEQAEKTQKKAYQAVFADASDFVDVDETEDALQKMTSYSEKEVLVNGVVEAKDGEELLGYVVTVTAKEGYGGDIKFSVGVDQEGNVTGISYLSISETAGLGMKAKDDAFVSQYTDKGADGDFIVNKDGSDGLVVDAISGATITSRAVTKGVNAACQVAEEISGGGDSNE